MMHAVGFNKHVLEPERRDEAAQAAADLKRRRAVTVDGGMDVERARKYYAYESLARITTAAALGEAVDAAVSQSAKHDVLANQIRIRLYVCVLSPASRAPSFFSFP